MEGILLIFAMQQIICLPITAGDALVFFGGSIAFAGSASEKGFVKLLDTAFPDEAIRIEGAGRLNFNFSNFVEDQVAHLFFHLTPDTAIFMVSDDELTRILASWLLKDQRARHDVAVCGTCDEFESVAKAMLAPLQLQLQKLLARVTEIAPSCRVVITTTLFGIYDTPVGQPRDTEWHTEGYIREQYLREIFVGMLEQLSFDFSLPSALLNPSFEHYHGAYQYNRFRVEIWDLGHVIGRVREMIYKADATMLVQPSLVAHGVDGLSHLDDISHAAMAYAIALYMSADTVQQRLESTILQDARTSLLWMVQPLLARADVSTSQLASWLQDSQKAIAAHMQSRSVHVQQLRARDHAARLEEELMYTTPILSESTAPGKIKANVRERAGKPSRRTKRNEL